MKNRSSWRPTKYVQHNGKLRASRNPRDVAVSSRLLVDLLASFYDRGLSEHARGRLLDLGCGHVPLYATYKDRVSEITCVDRANTLHQNQHLDLQCDLSEPLPLPDNSFDTIILSDVLEHVPTPELVCNEISRLLAPGGKVLISVPFFYYLHEEPHDYYRYTEYALRRLMKSSGLNVIQLVPVGGAPEIVTDIFAKNAMELPVIGPLLAKIAQFVTGRLVSTGIGHKISRSTAATFPFEYFLVAEKWNKDLGDFGD
jgi:SAM-dependent methyltransferase